MVLTRSGVLRTIRALCVLAFVPAAVCAQSAIEVYPGPGVDTYRSSRYTVEVFNGTGWVPSYVYQYSRKSVTYWRVNEFPSVSFTTFGTTGPVEVRVTNLGGAITDLQAYPASKTIRGGKISGSQATGTVNPGDKFWLVLNGDDANPLFVFADAPRPCIPQGATYFGPGIRDIAPAAGNHYKASSNEVIYLDGGAWVRGNIDIRGTSNVQITGPGILSGDLWQGENIGATFEERLNYTMIYGDWNAGNNARVSGITIVDSPGYNFFGGARYVSGLKILSPWFYSTDAFQGVSHVDHVFCFNGDNIFTPGWAGVQGENVTYTSSFVSTALNSVFSGGYWGNPASNAYTSLADDIDIRVLNSDVGLTVPLAGVFQIWVDNSDSTMGYRNQTYQNIRIDNYAAAPVLLLKNVVYPFGGPSAVNPPLGNSSNLVFKNISVDGTQRTPSEIKGLDANNGFHNVTLDNFSFNGVVVNQSNLAQYFDVNSFVTGLGYTAPAPPCVADATTLCLADGRFRVRAAYDTDTSSGSGQGVALTSDTGYFWFFSPGNVEMVVKVLNGCGLNQNFWVFAGGLTNVGVTLSVTDARTGVTRSYRNVRGTAYLPLQQTGDFGVCSGVSVPPAGSRAAADDGAGLEAFSGGVARAAKRWSSPAVAETGKPALVTTRGDRWAAGDSALCLDSGRFQVRVSYDTSTASADGHGVALSSDTGYFWFFSPGNVELIVKVLNACSINGNFWVFAGGLTNVGVNLTVTDTQTGVNRTYRNVRGTAYLPLQRTADFGVCP